MKIKYLNTMLRLTYLSINLTVTIEEFIEIKRRLFLFSLIFKILRQRDFCMLTRRIGRE